MHYDLGYEQVANYDDHARQRQPGTSGMPFKYVNVCMHVYVLYGHRQPGMSGMSSFVCVCIVYMHVCIYVCWHEMIFSV
jgi:hypothetical protein